jgi:uncharacterized protein
MQRDAVLLDLSAIIAQPGAKGSFVYALELPAEADLATKGAVKVALTAQSTEKALIVRGAFEGKVILPCARCLEDVVVDLRGEIQEQFSLPGITEPDFELIDQVEPREAAFADQTLNVSELVRQQLLVSLPLRALCRPDCRGICPGCGVNLDQERCQCSAAQTDPAWEALRALTEKKKSTKQTPN